MPDLRNKILFLMGMVLLYRIGVAIRVPGIDQDAIRQFKASAETQGALGFLNLFSGGAFASFSIFALGIMPYITASIIMQVLGVVIPKLEKLQQEGAVGQRKITQYTRYLAIAISTLQATALTFIFGNGNGNAFFGAAQNLPTNLKLLPDGMWPRGYLVILTLVGGTAVLMWLGELISQRGIGNGMSMVIFASVVSSLPSGFAAVWAEKNWFVFALLLLLCIGIVIAVVRVELAQRRIPVQFAKRVVGRRMYGGQSTYIPLKVNQSGVVPIIFASSVLLLPVLLTNLLGGADGGWRFTVQQWVDGNLVNDQGVVYIVLFSLMIVAFAYFYNSIAFDPIRQADQIRRQGGFIPGVRPGPQTERYLGKAVNRITLPGAVFVAVIAIMPYLLLWAFGVRNFPFAGTTELIAVGVSLELMRQIDSQLMLRNYEGFLK
ncbi:MAG: preprotein translocase subunit SecY [Actinomycetota bacterium]|nr:preprotein translocase subunit SecY [Actinomycetota bacterium]